MFRAPITTIQQGLPREAGCAKQANKTEVRSSYLKALSPILLFDIRMLCRNRQISVKVKVIRWEEKAGGFLYYVGYS
jgi:hypothetical protein